MRIKIEKRTLAIRIERVDGTVPLHRTIRAAQQAMRSKSGCQVILTTSDDRAHRSIEIGVEKTQAHDGLPLWAREISPH